MRRILNNFEHHSNWLGYYKYKYFDKGTGDFNFDCRSGIRISVPKRLLHTYKECFFDETYLKGLPKKLAKPVVTEKKTSKKSTVKPSSKPLKKPTSSVKDLFKIKENVKIQKPKPQKVPTPPKPVTPQVQTPAKNKSTHELFEDMF